MFRWSHLIPRLIIVGLLILAAFVTMDSIVRYAIVQNGQSITGARIEIGEVRTSIRNGRVYLSDLRIADPRNPMMNMVQADSAYMLLNPQELLHRKIVIESGTTHQILFGAPRTESGMIANRTTADPTPAEATAPLNSAIPAGGSRGLATGWLDSLKPQKSVESNKDLQILQVAAQIRDRWPAEFESRRRQITNLKTGIQQVKTVLREIEGNPLRIKEAQTQLLRLQNEIAVRQGELIEMEKRANEDRELLVHAAKRDHQAMDVAPFQESFDAEGINRVLLTGQQQNQVDEIISWFRWFRSTVPNPGQDFQPSPVRGSNVKFGGVPGTPDFLIKELQLDGEGHFAGQHFSFSGSAKDVATEPELHDQPLAIELRAQGKKHLILNCTLDRRGDSSNDSMYISSPDIETDPVQLGEQQALLISMGQAKVQVEVSVRVNEEVLSGDIIFRYSDVSLFADQVNELAGGEEVTLFLNQELSGINDYQTKVQISGSLDQPEFRFDSDLGTRIAGMMNRATAAGVKRQVVALNQRLQSLLDQEIANLDNTVQSNLLQIAELLETEKTEVAELQKSTRQDSGSGIFR